MAATYEMQEIAVKTKPYSCCIVPEKRQEVTTEGGLDVYSQKERIKELIEALHGAGIVVSLFIDPDEKQIRASSELGSDYIELHTGAYANAYGSDREEEEFQKLKKGAALAQSLGLKVNAGHGLNYQNVLRMHDIPNLCDLNIGHTIISKAIFTGLESAIKEMIELLK